MRIFPRRPRRSPRDARAGGGRRGRGGGGVRGGGSEECAASQPERRAPGRQCRLRPRRPWAWRLTLPGADGAGRAEAGQGGGHQGPAAPLRRRRLLEAAAGHLLALRAGGAGPAHARRDPQGRRQHARPRQELPGRPPQAPHPQGSAEERLGGY